MKSVEDQRAAWREERRRQRAKQRGEAYETASYAPRKPGRRRKYPAAWSQTDKARFLQFGVAPEGVIARLRQQGGCCAICRTSEPRGKGDWHLDHDHRDGRVRGVLCHGCNTALGMLRDDPARARAAADYIDRHAQLQALL